MSEAQEQIDRFRKGGRFQPPAPRIFTAAGGERELAELAGALAGEPSRVREQIVRMLEDAGLRSDPMFARGGTMIRDRRIVDILTTAGLAADDLGREAALQALHAGVPPGLLREYGKVLTADLKARPSQASLRAVAKAKPPEAVPVVRALLDMPRWKDERDTKIAAAALGDKGLEAEFVKRFLKAATGEEMEREAKVLGWIGTDGTLRALASQMRTPLITGVANAFDKSVRLDIMDALRFNFPENPVLYQVQLVDDSGYARVEQFCEKQFGTQWDKPRPPYLKVFGYPSGIPPQ